MYLHVSKTCKKYTKYRSFGSSMTGVPVRQATEDVK